MSTNQLLETYLTDLLAKPEAQKQAWLTKLNRLLDLLCAFHGGDDPATMTPLAAFDGAQFMQDFCDKLAAQGVATREDEQDSRGHAANGVLSLRDWLGLPVTHWVILSFQDGSAIGCTTDPYAMVEGERMAYPQELCTLCQAFVPDWVSPPGDTVSDWLLVNGGDTVDTLAPKLGITPRQLTALLIGELALTPALAQKLSVALGSTVDFWLTREAQYRAGLAARKGGT